MKTIYFLTVCLLSMIMAFGEAVAEHAAAVSAQQQEMNISGAGSSVNVGDSGVNIQSPVGAITIKTPIKTPAADIIGSLSSESGADGSAGSGFTNGELVNIDFSNQNLTGKSFVNADIVNCNFTGANLSNTDFSGADISGSNFSYAVLVNSLFVNANITGCNISFANFTNANLTNADIDNVIRNGVVFTDAILINVDMDGFVEQQYSRKEFHKSQEILKELAKKDTSEARIDLNVNFAFDSDQLTDSGRKQVAEIAAALKAPSLQAGKFLLEGHTDSEGSDSYNIDLSTRRAITVSQTLQNEYGVKVDLITKGYGEARPVATNETEAGRALNRRVSIVRIK